MLCDLNKVRQKKGRVTDNWTKTEIMPLGALKRILNKEWNVQNDLETKKIMQENYLTI